jgi:hypothetical protein
VGNLHPGEGGQIQRNPEGAERPPQWKVDPRLPD